MVLRDAQGMLVSWVEWGTFDRNPPGTPFTGDPPAGSSLTRVDTTGDSSNDFVIANTPTPFVGFMSSATMILGTTIAPRHVTFGGNYEVSAQVTDADGLNTVDIFFGTATSSAGPADGIYLSSTMTSSGSTYSFFDTVANLGGGFAEPTNFHSRYIRFFILAEDSNNDVTTEPPSNEKSGEPSILYLATLKPSRPPAVTIFPSA